MASHLPQVNFVTWIDAYVLLCISVIFIVGKCVYLYVLYGVCGVWSVCVVCVVFVVCGVCVWPTQPTSPDYT